MIDEKLHSACRQLLGDEDLIIAKCVKQKLQTEKFAVDIISKPVSKIKIYSKNELILSDIIPILHNLGFTVLDEVSFFVDEGEKIFINKIHIKVDDPKKLLSHKKNIEVLIEDALRKDILEKCKLFSLVYKENFTIRDILFVRIFLSYTDQLVAIFNKNKMIDTVVKYSHITKLFLDYFNVKFNPDYKDKKEGIENFTKKIETAFKEVVHINEDRVLRFFFEVLKSVVRTNYFLQKDTICIKVDVKSIKQHLRGIQPNIETFVYNQKFNGTHLRMGKVSRGGIRWSDRYDDFRVEIKSLMSAQESKNAVIIPHGAKGGFVIFKNRDKVSKEEFKEYYCDFINALLDVVDNKIQNKIVKDKNIISYDGDDPYFVVAADRGTSNMSDTANEISEKRGYWLKDAFASGGSYGYHHKKLGITARGALKSAERFFLEKQTDIYKESVRVVGIGSMNGDVFGNALIRSDKFKLIGAISHNEVFVDPNPDEKISFEERKRLFYAQKGSWSAYDKSKISKGGGVFKRDEKDIALSLEMKELFKTKRDFLSGEEIAKELLKTDVDMIYNGGVGTYFKAKDEENISIGDKINEFIRINADEIKAYCVCEGGNLGFTQKARIEYAKKGGRINLDSIDNCAGVNISDHEVNLKILLNSLMDKKVLTKEQRDENLSMLTDQVVNSVLWTNYFQPLCISLDERRSKKNRDDFLKSVRVLENSLESFNRIDFKIPQDSDVEEILTKEGTIIRPVLATLLLYSKIFLKNILNNSDMIEKEPAFDKFLFKYFPKSFVSVYEDEIREHHLKKEIMSMMIANEIINFFGSSFICDYEELEEERFLLKIKAYLIGNDLFRANDIRYELYRNDHQIESSKMYELLLTIEEAILYNANWMIKGLYEKEICYTYILEHQHSIDSLLSHLKMQKKEIVKGNERINEFFSKINYMKLVTGIIIVYKNEAQDFIQTGRLFYTLIEKLHIVTIMEAIEKVAVKDKTQAVLQDQLRKIIEILMIDLTESVLGFKRKNENEQKAVEGYLKERAFNTEEFENMINSLNNSHKVSIDDLGIVINTLLLI